MGLTQPTYVVQENMGEVEVCASLSGMIARDVTIRLSTTPDSAEGESDFTSLAEDIRTLLPSTQTEDVCWTISITNDDNVEEQEIFFVGISTDDLRVVLNPDTAQVTIMDEDCEYCVCNLSTLVMIMMTYSLCFHELILF